MALTSHREGSLKEFWTIAFPLMLSSLSLMSMLFVDRLLLAQHSISSLNAAVNAATLGWAFLFSWHVLGGISEVFVAQRNGAKQYDQLGAPVWQLVWISIASCLFFIPLAIWGSSIFYGSAPEREMERQYFFWMMLFGPSCPFYAALCGFFVGQGKTRIITVLAISANALNALLDVILIFGWEGWIPAMGVTGAAIATSGSSVFQAVVLAIVFLKRKNQTLFGTNRYKIDFQLLIKCLKIGLPGAVFVALEIGGWAVYYEMMRIRGESHLLIAAACQSLIILLIFFSEGISKAATALAGNYIGANKENMVYKVFMNGARLQFFFFIAISVAMMFGVDYYSSLFLDSVSDLSKIELRNSLEACLICIAFYLLFEGLRALISGILTAGGDTLFLLLGGTFSIWVLLVMPIYFFIVVNKGSIETASLICLLYSIASAIFYYYRFYQGRWKPLPHQTHSLLKIQ